MSVYPLLNESLGPKILVSQKPTESLRTTYEQLTNCYGGKIDFRTFTKVKFISLPQFRTHKPNICKHTAFIFTNKVSMDGFFNLAKACNIAFPLTTKYFLANEELQNYLKKYVEVKKRKVFYGDKKIEDLFPMLQKRHKKERFLFPCSDLGKNSLSSFFKRVKYSYTEIPIYSNSYCDLKDLSPNKYDIIVFFSPFSVRAFSKNFPNYNFGKTKVAILGEKTKREVQKINWHVDIEVPSPEALSMVQGLDNYLGKTFQHRINKN